MKTEAKKHYDAMKAHMQAKNHQGYANELELALRADSESACICYEAGFYCYCNDEWQAARNYLANAIFFNSQQSELSDWERVHSLQLLGECAAGLEDKNLAYSYYITAQTLYNQLNDNEDDEDIDDLINGLADEVDEDIVKQYMAAMQTSFPEPNSISQKTATKKEYCDAIYDFIDNGAGELMIVMNKLDGEIDDDNAKFLFDGISKGLIVRNSMQFVRVYKIVDPVLKMLNKIEKILVTEMDGEDIDDVYEAYIEINKDPGLYR